jgi:hypothetical protein
LTFDSCLPDNDAELIKPTRKSDTPGSCQNSAIDRLMPRPLREIDYFSLAEAFAMQGFMVREVFDRHPEVHRFEYSDLGNDLHVWLFPLNDEVIIIEGADSEEQSFEFVPVPSSVRFSGYSRFFEILRRFAFSGDELV